MAEDTNLKFYTRVVGKGY